MTLSTFQAIAAGMWGFFLLVLCIAQWVLIRSLTKTARQAIEAVHDFAGFMDGYACGPAESEMVSRCLPLANLINYDHAEDEP
jgi:hypothetical protein